jgi:hypothetical protein
MRRKTTAPIPATPANQPNVARIIPENETIDVEDDGTAPASKKRVHWEKHGHGVLGLYVSEEDIDKHTIPA